MGTQPESKHTPGPWEAYYVSSAGWSVRMAKPRDGYDKPDPICSMAWWQFDKPGVIDDAISEANARLIAAAPKMLEALKAVVEHQNIVGGSLGAASATRIIAERAIRLATETPVDNQPGDMEQNTRSCE